MNCPRCGHKNPEKSRFCNKCGMPFIKDVAATLPRGESASARSIIAFVLGVLSIIAFGFLSGIPAMILGRQEEEDIKRGKVSSAGETLAKLGFWLGLIGTILSGLIVLIIFFVIFASVSIPIFIS